MTDSLVDKLSKLPRPKTPSIKHIFRDKSDSTNFYHNESVLKNPWLSKIKPKSTDTSSPPYTPSNLSENSLPFDADASDYFFPERRDAGLRRPASGSFQHLGKYLGNKYKGGKKLHESNKSRNGNVCMTPPPGMLEGFYDYTIDEVEENKEVEVVLATNIKLSGRRTKHMSKDSMGSEYHSRSRSAYGNSDESIFEIPVYEKDNCKLPEFAFHTNATFKDSNRHPTSCSSIPRIKNTPLQQNQLSKRCQYLEAEVGYLREHESALAENLNKAEAEKRMLSLELAKMKEEYKEALSARRTARESLTEMAQQNARLISAYVEKKEEVNNIKEAFEEERDRWKCRVEKLEDQLQDLRCRQVEQKKVESRKQQRNTNSIYIDTYETTETSFNETFEEYEYSAQSSDAEKCTPDFFYHSEVCSPCASPGSLADIQAEYVRLQEENRRLRENMERAEQKQKEIDDINKVEEIKKEGNKQFKLGNYAEAEVMYSRALELVKNDLHTIAVLKCNRAAALINMDRYLEAIIDCYGAIEDDSSYTRSYQRRSDAYAALGDYSAAMQDLETLIKQGKLGSTPEVKIQISELKRKMSQGQLIDVYKVLGVATRAKIPEIKSAYKKLALKFHPDKAGQQPGTDTVFKLISHAHSVLSDEARRKQYDLTCIKRIQKSFHTTAL